ncbi:hypothetical protein HDV64DRAFT_135371 [Trichoderma sp. TUCIM 5745]
MLLLFYFIFHSHMSTGGGGRTCALWPSHGELIFLLYTDKGSQKIRPDIYTHHPLIDEEWRNGYIVDPIPFLKGWEALGLLPAAICHPIVWYIDD